MKPIAGYAGNQPATSSTLVSARQEYVNTVQYQYFFNKHYGIQSKKKMKALKKNQLEDKEYYLVYTGHNFTPSGFDIAEFNDGELISQTTNTNLYEDADYVKEIYELPVPKNI